MPSASQMTFEIPKVRRNSSSMASKVHPGLRWSLHRLHGEHHALAVELARAAFADQRRLHDLQPEEVGDVAVDRLLEAESSGCPGTRSPTC